MEQSYDFGCIIIYVYCDKACDFNESNDNFIKYIGTKKLDIRMIKHYTLCSDENI